MGRHDLHRAVERLARQQHGVITREQALSLGFTPRMVEGLLRSQAWTTLGPSIYALAPFPPTWQREYKAAELSVREAGLGGLAAARVLDFEGFGVARPEVVTETYTVNARSELAIVHRARDVRFTTARGFRVTTPAQTLADLVTRVRLDRWERAADGLLLTRAMTVDDLVERVQAYEGHRRPGIATLRALVAVRTNEGWVPPATELETLLRQAVAEVPDCPPVLWRVGMPWGEVDGMIPDWGIVLEGDGRRWHARVADFERDRWRDNQAAAHGLRFLRFTWTQLNERRAEVVSTITAAGRASRTAA